MYYPYQVILDFILHLINRSDVAVTMNCSMNISDRWQQTGSYFEVEAWTQAYVISDIHVELQRFDMMELRDLITQPQGYMIMLWVFNDRCNDWFCFKKYDVYGNSIILVNRNIRNEWTYEITPLNSISLDKHS
ncbi:Riboflavin synthase alpha chain [Candidatus Hodgkinia cicadicola]|uniref:Riboflavin synthase alpha chain n=1 Tax=Candidatus Hodgkinia cicadicola TaxID=573658 RepID=A0ABX4MHA4_9HYPH|nr:Riboflavin synthase alpha chain [Candidatus Hodgkinia cicadicola]PIM96141.1 Riboflavin synthase alpha chain [Candidatus Hodgkinia cicadicola]